MSHKAERKKSPENNSLGTKIKTFFKRIMSNDESTLKNKKDEDRENELMEKEVKESRTSPMIEEKEKKSDDVPKRNSNTMETDDEDEAQANNNARYNLRSQVRDKKL